MTLQKRDSLLAKLIAVRQVPNTLIHVSAFFLILHGDVVTATTKRVIPRPYAQLNALAPFLLLKIDPLQELFGRLSDFSPVHRRLIDSSRDRDNCLFQGLDLLPT